MPVKPLLPALLDGKGPANLTDAGVWNSYGRDELANIADILKVNVQRAKVNSIPSPWARPLLFETALFNPTNILHSEVRDEWEGLLALLAFSEYKQIPLEVRAVDLFATTNQRDERILLPLQKLVPTTSVSSDTTWAYSYVFLISDSPIGMTSPTTLVTTATDYGYSGIDIDWYQGNKLCSPVEYLSPDEKGYLAGWVANLKQSLNEHGSNQLQHGSKVTTDARILNSLNSLLDAFGNKLGDRMAYPLGTRRLGIGILQRGVLSYLDVPIGSEVQSGEGSHVRLISSAEKQPLQDFLIFSEKIPDAWRVGARQVRVYRHLMLQDGLGIGGRPGGTHSRFANVDLQGAEIWHADDLFCSKLVLVRNKASAFPGTVAQNWAKGSPKHNENPTSVLFPINKKLLDVFTPTDLNERVTFEQLPNNNIEVKLRLTLSGLDGNGKDFVAVRRYELNDVDQFRMLDSLPIIEVFPNFRRFAWKANYTAYSTDNVNATFEATPLDETGERKELHIAPGGRRTIWRTDSFPEVLTCRYEGEEVGLLILNPADGNRFDRDKSFTVGVDFGASGSCMYAREQGQKHADPVDLENLNLTVTDKGEARRSELFDFFLPDLGLSVPFLSLFQPLYPTDTNANRPLLDGHVYFFEDRLATDIVPNLKWSSETDPQSIRYIKSFLTQLAIQTTASLVLKGGRSVDWRFSYPTAFSNEQVDDYKNVVCKDVVKSVTDLCGFRGHKPIFKKSESLASATYFQDIEKAPTELGTIFIDIGSSTSDISVWQGSIPILQMSLRYAGRDVFLDYLIRHTDVLQVLLGSEKTQELTDANFGRLPRQTQWAILDLILRKNTNEIFEQHLGDHISNQEIKKVRSYLAFGLGGLFFYLGLCTRNLVQERKYRHEIPTVHIGGNGALMFRWLTNGALIEEYGLVAKVFEKLFLAGLNTKFPAEGHGIVTGVGIETPLNQEPLVEPNYRVDGHFNLKLSGKPKHEASYGIVCDDLDAIDPPEPSVIAGEAFVYEDTKYPWSSKVDGTKYHQGISVPKQLENLEAYISAFKDAAGGTDFGLMNFDVLQTRRRLANALAEYRRIETAKIVVEPVFIVALKQLLALQV